MTDVVMPQMGESIVEGTLTKWLKKAGERIERDEPLFEISTDKVDTEIPAPVAGTVSEILVQEGQTVGINTVVARINEGRELTKAVEQPPSLPQLSLLQPKRQSPPQPHPRSQHRPRPKHRRRSHPSPRRRSSRSTNRPPPSPRKPPNRPNPKNLPNPPARSLRWSAKWPARTISICRA